MTREFSSRVTIVFTALLLNTVCVRSTADEEESLSSSSTTAAPADSSAKNETAVNDEPPPASSSTPATTTSSAPTEAPPAETVADDVGEEDDDETDTSTLAPGNRNDQGEPPAPSPTPKNETKLKFKELVGRPLFLRYSQILSAIDYYSNDSEFHGSIMSTLGAPPQLPENAFLIDNLLVKNISLTMKYSRAFQYCLRQHYFLVGPINKETHFFLKKFSLAKVWVDLKIIDATQQSFVYPFNYPAPEIFTKNNSQYETITFAINKDKCNSYDFSAFTFKTENCETKLPFICGKLTDFPRQEQEYKNKREQLYYLRDKFAVLKSTLNSQKAFLDRFKNSIGQSGCKHHLNSTFFTYRRQSSGSSSFEVALKRSSDFIDQGWQVSRRLKQLFYDYQAAHIVITLVNDTDLCIFHRQNASPSETFDWPLVTITDLVIGFVVSLLTAAIGIALALIFSLHAKLKKHIKTTEPQNHQLGILRRHAPSVRFSTERIEPVEQPFLHCPSVHNVSHESLERRYINESSSDE